MIIDDLVILGRSCPDRTRNGRNTVCVGGYSPKLGFIRVYPTRIDFPMKRWDIVKVEVGRSNRDIRKESWKIVGSRAEWQRLSEKIETVGKLKKRDEKEKLVFNNVDGCITTLQKSGRSLGIIKPEIENFYFAKRKKYDGLIQLEFNSTSPTGMKNPLKTKKHYPVIPRIKYRCSNCGAKTGHDQQVLEWGCYEWIRRFPEKKEQLWENLRLTDPDYDIFFLVGNLNYHPRSFMIISVLRFKREPK